MIEFLGRLHPLIVHLPIGILLLTAALHLLSTFQKTKNYKSAAHVSLLIGALFSVIACITGYWLANETYEVDLLSNHKIFGLITAGMALILLWINNSKNPSFKKKRKAKINSAFYAIIIPLLFITGHFGGSLTHGSDFLFPTENEYAVESTGDSIDFNSTVYLQLIKPVLQTKCYRCHSSKKQKGKLRLDTEEYIVKGGKGGSILENKNNNPSELLYRIHLPIEDEDHMPPSDNDQLSSSDIDLLVKWIEDGAPFNTKLSSYSDSSSYLTYARTKFNATNSNWWPSGNAASPNEEAIISLKETGVSVELLSEENNYLIVSFVSIDSMNQNIWNNLLILSDNIISLKLSGVSVTQEEFNKLSSFKFVRKLYLDNISLTNPNLKPLTELKNLLYLNLSGMQFKDDQLATVESLSSLNHLILFNSNVTEETMRNLSESLPKCKIEFGKVILDELPSDTLIYRRK